MIKARGGLLSHAHCARGALVQHQASRKSLQHTPSLLTLDSSPQTLSPSRGFRGFLAICDRENNDSACRTFYGCSKAGSKHICILALWSFESKNPFLDQATRLTKPKGLHISTRNSLTTSELIKSLQLGKGGGPKTTTITNAAVIDDYSVEGEKVRESTKKVLDLSHAPERVKEECKPVVGAVKKPLSKLIPQHVVDMGFAKKESFSKKQDQQRSSGKAHLEILPRVSNQKRSIPVLRLESARNDTADADVIQEKQQKLSGQRHGSQVSELSSRGQKVTTGSPKHWDLVGAAFDTVPLTRKLGDSDFSGEAVPAGRQAPKHGESANMLNEKHFVTRGGTRKQTQGFCEGAALSRESSQLAGNPSSESKQQTEVQVQPCDIGERITGGQEFRRGKFTERHSESTQTWSAKQEFAHAERTSKLHGHMGQEANSESQIGIDVALSNKEINKLSGRQFAVNKGNTNSQQERDAASQQFEKKSTNEQFLQSEESMRSANSRNASVHSQHLRESNYLAEENAANTSYVSTFETASMQPLLNPIRQHRLLEERAQLIGRQSSLYQRSSNSAGESSEIAGKQPSTSSPFQKSSEDAGFASRQDTGLGVRRVSTFDKWASEGPEESGPAAPSKPYDRNRPRRKTKNELKEKDLSLKPIPGEPHYKYLIRRKQVRAEAQKALVNDVEDYEHVGDDWMKKRLGWLCKEIPLLKASGLVKMLNNQRKWIKQEHLKELIEHLVRYMELNRAHRVLKWMQQQPFYEFEYELHNNMAFILGRNDKLSRCQDVFDEIVRNGQFPDAPVFTALIKAYLDKGDKGDINDAWKLYNQMLQLELTVSESLSETLLKSLACPSGRWIRQAEELLVKMKASGMYINEEMYSRVMDLYGKRGDHKKIDSMMKEIKSNHLKLTVGILNAKLEACVKDGDTVRAEYTLGEIVELGLMPDWRSYAHLIQVFGKVNMPMNAWEIFEKMKGIGIPINFVTYHSIIDAMAAGGQHEEEVMQVLTELEESGKKPLQPCYNSVMNMYLGLKKYDEVEAIYNRGKAAKARPAHAAYNMLMKSYTERGQLEKAEALFQEMKATEGMGPNTHTYNILLEGYGVACFKERARELFEEMSAKGCQLDPDVRDKIRPMISVKRIAELEKKKLNLTDEQREIIPGLLLGGAKMVSPDRNRTYELHLEFNCENEVKRVIKDRLSFLFQAWWKPNQLVSSSESAATSECEGATVEASATKPFARLETVSHGSFRFYAHQYRPNGEPVIPKLIHRWLKPRTLSYWYMYGGRKCQRTGGIILNASKYSGKQIQTVVKALKARTMDCRRKKRRNGDVIRFEGRSAMWLWKLMEPHILNAVKEQLKPEEIPVDLALAEGTKSWDSQDQGTSDVDEMTSDEDDWDELDADRSEAAMEIIED